MKTPGLPNIRLVVFDLDGTLVDSSRDLAAAVNAMLARLAPGAAPLDHARVRSFIGDGARNLVARSLAARDLALDPAAALPVFLDAYRHTLLDTTGLYPGVREALAALAGSQRLAVLTNKPGEMSRAILAGLGILERFARVFGGDEVPRKPDPGGLLRLMQELRASPAETVMVGDSANDVVTGRAAAVRTVGVRYGFDRAGVEAQQPEFLVGDLRELVALLA